MPLHKYPSKIWEALKLKQGIYAFLPKHYLCSLEETTQATLVHWKALGVKYRANPKTGHKERSQDGLWGGEGWISGFRYANNDKVSTMKGINEYHERLLCSLYSQTHFILYLSMYPNILTITVTARTLDLIDAAYGFDYYILRTPKEDLRRAMLLRLSFKDTQLDPEDPVKKERIYTKHKQQFEIPAVEEQRQLEHKPEPLFKSCVENPGEGAGHPEAL
uniref:Mitochondrial ribosomal protein L28 n=1 Tax=Oncorhynchus kisutch TaxID=8019 RepID=A0A8C7L0U9_ONCKI